MTRSFDFPELSHEKSLKPVQKPGQKQQNQRAHLSNKHQTNGRMTEDTGTHPCRGGRRTAVPEMGEHDLLPSLDRIWLISWSRISAVVRSAVRRNLIYGATGMSGLVELVDPW